MKLRKLSLALTISFLCFALGACQKPQEKEARYLQRGNSFFEQGDYVKARLEYKNAQHIMPMDAEPRYRLGLVDEMEGDPRNAFANYLAAEQQNGHYHPALLKLAQYFLAINEYEQADHRLNIVLSETPDDPEAHALRGGILLRQKNYVAGEKEARLALAKNPASITATAVLTGIYSAQKDEAKAAAALQEGIAHNPNEISLLLLKASLYAQSSNLDKITEAYRTIFRLKPADESYRADLARIYVKAGKVKEAEAILREGVAAMPENWNMKKDLVAFLSDQRGMEAAEQEIKGLMQTNPGKDDLYFWLADLYITHNATDRAIALLQQIMARDESDPSALMASISLARIQFVKGNREMAEKLVSRALEKEPGNKEALLIRAQMAFDIGHYQDAVSDLRGIIRDAPHTEEAIKLLGETLLLQGHVDLAIDTLNQLLDFDPGNKAVTVRLAQLYNLNNNPNRASELLAFVTKAAPDYPLGWETKARIAISHKDWQAAEAAIATLDTLPDQHLTALFLKGQVLEMSGRPAEGVALYIQVAEANPLSPLAERALSAMAEDDLHMNKLQDAVDTLKGIKADSPFLSTLLGGCLLKQGKLDEAEAAFDKAIAEHATSQDPYVARASLYLKDKKTEDALRLLAKAKEVAPSDAKAPMLSADILSKLGRYQEAIAIYEELLAQNPGADVAANNLAEVIADYQYNDSASLDKARQTAERFSGSSNPLFLDTLGWVYYRQGSLQEDQVVMAQVMSSKEKLPPEVHYHYGALLVKLGKSQEAKNELTQAVASSADYAGREDAKKLLSGL